jgi:hypothetical protein
MPYFIYRISTRPLLRLEQLAQFASFKEASAAVKAQRAAPMPPDSSVRMIFAENELAAEDLLSQVRERQAGVIGDE